MDFIQHTVKTILGTPNLPDQWWGKGKAYSSHQAHLHSQIQKTPLDPNLFKIKNAPSSNQEAIATIIQSTALPRYKEPMPIDPSYRDGLLCPRVSLSHLDEDEYLQHLNKIEKKLTPARGIHGSMHCVRVALWTQLLSRVYEKLGKEKIDHPILLATTGAFHDIARENDKGFDYWDEEGAEALERLLNRLDLTDEQKKAYVQAIREKDPSNGAFSSDIQRIVHDADCLDIIRVVGTWHFSKKELCFYHFNPNKKDFCDRLINEIGDFINITENFQVRTYLEHHSEDFYGDLVRLLFAMNRNDPNKFSSITSLLKSDMETILQKSTKTSQELFKYFKLAA